MDAKLVGWARVVKARQRERHPRGTGPPALWLFTDRARMADAVSAIRRLPPGLAGVVLRDDGVGSAARGRRIALVCRQRRLLLSVAGEAGAGEAGAAARFGAGQHLRAGYRRAGPRPAFLTSSAHNDADVRRALRAGAEVIFLSPVFPTRSHPGAAALGVIRWAALGRSRRVGALGGIDGRSVRRLPGWCRHLGAIGALIG